MGITEVLIFMLVVSVIANGVQYRRNGKLVASLVKAATGLRALNTTIQERAAVSAEALVKAVMPGVEKMEGVPVSNSRKRITVATAYLQAHPRTSYRAVVAAVDEAHKQFKARGV